MFILASGSPRRKDLLSDLGLTFNIITADIDETPHKNENPKAYVQRMAREKALKVAEKNKGEVVVAADTTVVIGRRILGKPEDIDDARSMIGSLSGRRHRVLTSVCVIGKDGKVHEDMSNTVVMMRPLSRKEIEWFVSNTINWEGKAGGYGIQTSAGDFLIKGIQGSVTGVVGLPLMHTMKLLRRVGIDL